MTIFILAGGFGTRLQSIVKDVPKPMAPILHKPFLDYQIQEIRKYFPETIIYLLTYYLSESIKEHYKNDSLIQIIQEQTPLGTGGSIKNAIHYLNLKKSSNLLVINGDTYIKPNFTELTHAKNELTIVSSFQVDCSRYGTLTMNKKNQIITFNEKQDNSKNSYINAGCYYFKNIQFFQDIESTKFALEDAFKRYLDRYGKIFAYKYNDIFIDIGIPSDYEKMKTYIGNNYE